MSLGLELSLDDHLFKTTVAPTWNEICCLSEIIAILSVLNFFLMRELEQMDKSIRA